MSLDRRLFVGDTVRLDHSSIYWGQSNDTEGTVIALLLAGDYRRVKVPYNTGTHSEHIYQVKWKNGHSNSYRPEDLTLVKSILPQKWQVRVLGSAKEEWNDDICKWRTTGCAYGPWTSSGYLNEDGTHYGEMYEDRILLNIHEFYKLVLGISTVPAITISKYSDYVGGVDPFDLSASAATVKADPVSNIQKGEWVYIAVNKPWCNAGFVDVVMDVYPDGSIVTDQMKVLGYGSDRVGYHEYRRAKDEELFNVKRRLVGRHIKCRTDAPNAGSARKGDVGRINAINSAGTFEVHGFNQSPYSATPDFVSKYELLPHTYSPGVTTSSTSSTSSVSESHDYKVGDWIIICNSDRNMNNQMKKKIGAVVQITELTTTRDGRHVKVRFKNDDNWVWGTEWAHFRKALPHEIPEKDPNMIKYKALDPYIKNGSYYSRLAEQRYPKGTIIRRLHSNGKSDTGLITIDADTTVNTYMIRSGDVDAGANRSYLYVNGKWAEIVSRPSTISSASFIPSEDQQMIDRYREFDIYKSDDVWYSRKAINMYPHGTVYRCARDNKLYVVDTDTANIYRLLDTEGIDGGNGKGYLWFEGTWAEIVSSSQSAPLDLDQFTPPESWEVVVSPELKLSSKREKKKLLEEAIIEVPEVSVKIISKTQTKTI